MENAILIRKGRILRILAVLFLLFFLTGAEIVNASDTIAPAKITYFVTALPTSKTVALIWRSVGDDDKIGRASQYDIRYSTTPILTESDWNTATQVSEEPIPKPVNLAESFFVPGLSPLTTYYFAIKAGDAAGNWGPLSNSPKATTTAVYDTVGPNAVVLGASYVTPTAVTLSWKSPNDKGNTLYANHASGFYPYDIRYSTAQITEANWNSATQAVDEPVPQQPGYDESYTVSGLSPNTQYYFAIKTADDIPNWSPISTVSATTANGSSQPPAMLTNFKASNPDKIYPYSLYPELRVYDYPKDNPPSAEVPEATGVKLSWTAPASGLTASNYYIRYSISPIMTESDWNSAVPAVISFYITSANAGQTEQLPAIRGLTPNTTYYFAIRWKDWTRSMSPISANAVFTTAPRQTTPNKKLFFHEGAVFPSPNLAPISTPYITGYLAPTCNTCLYPYETAPTGYWQSSDWRMAMEAGGRLGMPYVGLGTSSAVSPSSVVSGTIASFTSKGFKTVHGDEWAAWGDPRVANYAKAVRENKINYPNLLAFAAFLNNDIDYSMAGVTDTIDVYVNEVYFNRFGENYDLYLRQYSDAMKYYDMEGESMGIYNAQPGNPAKDLDFIIKYLRALSPRGASLGADLFKLDNMNDWNWDTGTVPATGTKIPGITRQSFYDAIKANFWDVSPSVSITSPANNAVLGGTVRIYASSTANADSKAPVVSYRYFIDNVLVKISPTPYYNWNTAGYSQGKHVITVHAVDSEYLAGVSQINVSLGETTTTLDPVFTPPTGTYSSAQNITITTSTSGATIYYTLDGSDPATSPTRDIYSSTITVSSTTTIKAKAFKDSLTPSETVSATYTIAIPALTSISVSPASTSIAIGSTQTFIANPKDQFGNPITTTITLSSNNTNVGTISTAGVFTALAEGTATITASSGTVNGTATAIVTPLSSTVNLLTNPGFESGTAAWAFYTNSAGAFTTASPGYAGINAAKVTLNSGGTNIQLYQTGLSFEPNTKYRLSFAAYSSTGNDIIVNLIRHSDGVNYGLSQNFNLGTSWQVFTTEFTTCGFTSTVNDGRLFFWLAPFAKTGDTYYIDNVTLESIDVKPLVATLTFSPAAGTYTTSQNITISTTTTDTTIHYTLDGTTPTETSPIYTTPITISSNTTLKARAWKTGMTPSSITSAAYTINIPVNLSLNPGFESNPAVNYASFGNGTFSWASDYKHTGEKSLKIVSSQPTEQFARWISKQEQISASAGKTYTASVWMKTNGLRQYGELLINFWDANLNYLNKYYISNHATGTTDWAKLTVSGIAPANTKYIRAEFRIYGPGTIWIDDVEVK